MGLKACARGVRQESHRTDTCQVLKGKCPVFQSLEISHLGQQGSSILGLGLFSSLDLYYS